MEESKHESVFDKDKAQGAIRAALELFAERELNIAECCHVVNVLNATFKGKYPEVYRLMTGKK